jgi:hypothetical protein
MSTTFFELWTAQATADSTFVSAGATRNRRVTLIRNSDKYTPGAETATYYDRYTPGAAFPAPVGTLASGASVTLSSGAYFFGSGKLMVEDL